MNRGSEHHAPGSLATTDAGQTSRLGADGSIRRDLFDPCPSCGDPGPHEPGAAPTAVQCRRGICGARWGDHGAIFGTCAANGDLGEDTRFAALSAIREPEDRGTGHDADAVAAILRSVLTET